MELAKAERTEKEASTNSTGKGNLYSLKNIYIYKDLHYIYLEKGLQVKHYLMQ